jgi:hypothetical protein
MKEDYPLKGETTKVSIELEKGVAETLNTMSEYSKLKVSELVNTAVKRFIAVHSDFLPPKKRG